MMFKMIFIGILLTGRYGAAPEDIILSAAGGGQCLDSS
jgi:hypothetical protein